MFIDKARIFVTAGNGGPGCISFRREKYVPLGGPDGGNGGRGGDVYFISDIHLNTLLDFKYKPHFKAGEGSAGGSANKYGKSADDLFIKVPVGTVITSEGELVADLNKPDQKVLAAKGGRGGRGNAAFKTSRNTAPRISEKGEPGQKITLDLELKLIADVGLIGFPNAGKSSLLSRISAAHPKIADYPFTTLTPNLGVVNFGEKNFVVVDIPGLIEGAHSGKGLGDEFLRHVQRTRVLIHLVDLFGFDNKPAYKNYRAINKELKDYAKKLSLKPMLIAPNKMDITDSDVKLKEFKKYIKTKKIYPISAVSGQGVKELIAAAVKVLNKPQKSEEKEQIPVKKYIYEPDFIIEYDKKDEVFVVKGKKVEKLGIMTDFNQEESLQRFQNILKKMGVEKALEEKGIKPGNTVRIGKQEFEYEK